MALTASSMSPLGGKAPSFSLPDIDGKLWNFRGSSPVARGLLVAFICNHCPYVKHLNAALSRLAAKWQANGLDVFGICSNDVGQYPQDSRQKLAEQKREFGFTFPYLIDETQEVARAFRATCTPDFFLYDENHALVYRGQFDETRPGQGLASGASLDEAISALFLQTGSVAEQIPSMGCNIKWKLEG